MIHYSNRLSNDNTPAIDRNDWNGVGSKSSVWSAHNSLDSYRRFRNRFVYGPEERSRKSKRFHRLQRYIVPSFLTNPSLSLILLTSSSIKLYFTFLFLRYFQLIFWRRTLFQTTDTARAWSTIFFQSSLYFFQRRPVFWQVRIYPET